VSASTAPPAPETETVLSPTVGRVARRGVFWVVAALIALAAVIAVSLGTGAVRDANALSAENASPNGAKALVEVLRDQGVTVTATDTVAGIRAALPVASDSTLLVFDRDLLLDDDLRKQLLSLAATVVLVEPDFDTLTTLAPSVAQAGSTEGELTAVCDLPAAAAAGSITGDGSGYRLLEPVEGAISCFPSGDGVYSVLQVPLSPALGSGEVTVLGASAALTNETIGDYGNAALALTLLGQHDNLAWYIPGTADVADGLPPTLGELSPGWVTPAIILLLLVLLAAAIWRGRRLGPLVVENLPVTVRASETMQGRARLYQKSSARQHALDSLRIGTISRIALKLGLPSTAPVEAIVAAASAQLGVDPARVRTLLIAEVPGSDADLVRLSDALLTLERDLAVAVRPG